LCQDQQKPNGTGCTGLSFLADNAEAEAIHRKFGDCSVSQKSFFKVVIENLVLTQNIGMTMKHFF